MLVALQRAARAAARAERQRQIDEDRRVREAVRLQREKLRLQSAMDRAGRQQYQQERAEEAQSLTAEVEARVVELSALLAKRRSPTQADILSSLEYREPLPVLAIPAELGTGRPQPARSAYLSAVSPRTWWEKLTGNRVAFEFRKGQAEERFRTDFLSWQAAEQARLDQIAAIRQQHAVALAGHQEKRTELERHIEEFAKAYGAGDGGAVVSFFEMVLDSSEWPEGSGFRSTQIRGVR